MKCLAVPQTFLIALLAIALTSASPVDQHDLMDATPIYDIHQRTRLIDRAKRYAGCPVGSAGLDGCFYECRAQQFSTGTCVDDKCECRSKRCLPSKRNCNSYCNREGLFGHNFCGPDNRCKCNVKVNYAGYTIL